MRLENITWPQAQKYFENNDTVIVPIGIWNVMANICL